MKINFSCEIGDGDVMIPVNIGDIVISSGTNYLITKIVVYGDTIFAVDTSGLWVNLKNLRFEKKDGGKNYFKIIH